MIRPRLGAYVAVFSHARPANVAAMTALIGPATWYVGAGEMMAYAAAGAPMVVESGPLCASRNAALRDAWSQGVPCVELSDDLRRIRRAPGGEPFAFADATRVMLGRLEASGLHLAGAATTDNLYFFNPARPVSTDLFVVGDWVAVRPCGLFFDERLRLKEDYDYTLQHLKAFGGVVRCNDIVPAFAHRTNPGGAVAVRTPALERASIAYLKRKWPGCIRDNPRRPDEILMTAKPVLSARDQTSNGSRSTPARPSSTRLTR